MVERSDQLTRTRSDTEIETDHEVGLDGTETEVSGPDSGTSLRERAGTLFSPTRFLLALVLSAVGLFAGSATIPLVGGVLGILFGTFIVGLLSDGGTLAETGTAGATVLGASMLFDYLVWTLAGVGVPIVAVGAVVGLGVGALGGYLGADLRDGLTRGL